MCVRRGRYIDYLGASAPDRLVEIGEGVRHSAAFSALTSALGVRTYEARDLEACGS
jgi:hypothetical protein